MKTKMYKLLVAIAFMVCGASHSYGQNYYTPGQTIVGDGFTYVCELDTYMSEYGLTPSPITLRLQDIGNTLSDHIPLQANGKHIPFIDPPNSYAIGDALPLICNIFASVLSVEDRRAIQNNQTYPRPEMLFMRLYINSQTGRVMEVVFSFNSQANGFINLAPEKYFQIETMMKEQLVFQINDIGRTYNFNLATIPFRSQDIGVTYDFDRKVWNEPDLRP